MKRIKLMLDEVQWSIVRGILEEAGIPFSILNEQFSSLYPGMAVGAFGREVWVADEECAGPGTASGVLEGVMGSL